MSVRVERLDQILAGERVDFIKLDVQGWELEVFRGMEGLLHASGNAALAIFFEFWPQGLRDAGSDPEALLRFLAERGFTIHRPKGGKIGEAKGDLSALAAEPMRAGYTNLYALRASKSSATE